METERVDGVGSRGGTCRLCRGEHYATDILLNCQEQKRWRKNFLDKKWLQVNEEVAFAKPVRCSNTKDPRQLSILLYIRSDASGSTTQKSSSRTKSYYDACNY